MTKRTSKGPALSCPSAQPDWENSKVVGIVQGTVEQPMVAFLDRALPVTDELLAQTRPAPPTAVLRISATCIENACVHFKHRQCTLVGRILDMLEPVVSDLPGCNIRSSCRWYFQAGSSACVRCPQVVTKYAGPSKELADLSVVPEQGQL